MLNVFSHGTPQIASLGLLLLLIGWPPTVRASHNLAGQITYERIGTNTYEILLTTYTDPLAAGVDRCFADIEVWGVQGQQRVFVETLSDIPRENGPLASDCDGQPLTQNGVFVRPSIKRNFYRVTWTAPGPGVFELRYFDIARVNNVTNMSNSGATTFFVETILNNDPFIGQNNSPVLLNEPLDDACMFRKWSHNPGGFDPDGDSLSYALIPNRQYNPPDVPTPITVSNYQFPDNFGGPFTIDPETGLIVWDAVTQVGVYNIAIEVSEWRDGVKIGEVVRDMAIFVDQCDNFPPEIDAVEDTCVQPGETLRFPVTVSDPDPADSNYFFLNNGPMGNNGPFAVPTDSATFTSNLGNPNPSVEIPSPIDQFVGTFEWNVTCQHVRRQFYQVDFFSHDDIIHDGAAPFALTLVDNHVTKITVRPQPLDTLIATPGSRSVNLEWSRHPCPTAIGYEIYRNNRSVNVPIDSVCCDLQNVQQNYELIATVSGRNDTTFVDDNDGQGLDFSDTYCYRVVALFPDNLRSCPTNESCSKILTDFSIMLHDSVSVTDSVNGSIFVEWTQPDSIDTVFFPKPYTYQLFRAPVGGNFQAIASGIGFDDTTFFDTGLNTADEAWRYNVRVFDSTGREIEQSASNTAQSIFLETLPRFQSVQLRWNEVVPWENTEYIIFQADTFAGPYQPIDTVAGTGATQHSYTVNNLVNGEDFCFFIRGIGTYNTPQIESPLLNDSQRDCEIPRDTIPPCLPSPGELSGGIQPNCEELTVDFNLVRPPDSCGGDLARYQIFYTPDSTLDPSAFELLNTLEADGDSSFSFSFDGRSRGSIAGCYRIRGQDSLLNTSRFSEPFCFDNCPVIQLPNVFTPNGDGSNDVIRPLDVRSVKRLDLQIVDRWGNEVFTESFQEVTPETQLWDGTTDGGRAHEGVYFYQATITLEKLVDVQVTRTGQITLFR